MIKVVNKRTYKGKGHYIGRPSPLGNPYPMENEKQRDEVIQLYRMWLWTQLKEKNSKVMAEMRKLTAEYAANKELVLICHCAPKKCHGDVIANAIRYLMPKGV